MKQHITGLVDETDEFEDAVRYQSEKVFTIVLSAWALRGIWIAVFTLRKCTRGTF